jgi:hypothetical protein
MSEITRVGVDLAKNVIQVDAVNAQEKLVTNRKLERDKFMQWCVHLPAGCIVVGGDKLSRYPCCQQGLRRYLAAHPLKFYFAV